MLEGRALDSPHDVLLLQRTSGSSQLLHAVDATEEPACRVSELFSLQCQANRQAGLQSATSHSCRFVMCRMITLRVMPGHDHDPAVAIMIPLNFPIALIHQIHAVLPNLVPSPLPPVGDGLG